MKEDETPMQHFFHLNKCCPSDRLSLACYRGARHCVALYGVSEENLSLKRHSYRVSLGKGGIGDGGYLLIGRIC